jgi:thiosulfate/3-mercaptopyruvate sulfurtransferase
LRRGPPPAVDSHQANASSASASGTARAAPPARFAPRPDYLIDTAQAYALRTEPNAALVSIRTRAEHLGETSGYPYIHPRGEIAGALWGHAGLDGDVNSMRNFQQEDGRMKPAAEIAALWLDAGIRPEMRIAFYCGTGWRASLAFFYAWMMGWERISVYDGGWLEWSADPTHRNSFPKGQ